MVLVISVARWLKPRLRKYGVRSPIYNREIPNPSQWLIDIAQHDAENPQGELREISKSVIKWDLEPSTRRPWIEVAVKYFNGGVHPILIGPIKGRPKYNGDQLQDLVEEGAKHRVTRGETDSLSFKVYLPPDVAKRIYDEELSVHAPRSFRRIRSLDFSDIKLEVESEPIGEFRGIKTRIGLGGNNIILAGDAN